MKLQAQSVAGIQHETDQDGMPWWDIPSDDCWGVCPECGADSWDGLCTYDGEHTAHKGQWHTGRCAS